VFYSIENNINYSIEYSFEYCFDYFLIFLIDSSYRGILFRTEKFGRDFYVCQFKG